MSRFRYGEFSFAKLGDDLHIYSRDALTDLIRGFFKGERGVKLFICGCGKRVIEPNGPPEEFVRIVGTYVPTEAKHFIIDVRKADGKIISHRTYVGRLPGGLYEHLESWERVDVIIL